MPDDGVGGAVWDGRRDDDVWEGGGWGRGVGWYVG
jgi:hypothetical protein